MPKRHRSRAPRGSSLAAALEFPFGADHRHRVESEVLARVVIRSAGRARCRDDAGAGVLLGVRRACPGNGERVSLVGVNRLLLFYLI